MWRNQLSVPFSTHSAHSSVDGAIVVIINYTTLSATSSFKNYLNEDIKIMDLALKALSAVTLRCFKLHGSFIPCPSFTVGVYKDFFINIIEAMLLKRSLPFSKVWSFQSIEFF